MSTPRQEFRKSILVFRHGSRGPSKVAYSFFAKNPLIQEQWKIAGEEGILLERLTDTGKNLCVQLGEWTRKHLQEKHGKLTEVHPDDIQWQSSIVDRVINSGDSFWRGFLGSQYPEVVPERKQYPGNNKELETDKVFRPWGTHTDYSAWSNEIEKGKSAEFQRKAEERWEDLKDILTSLKVQGVERLPKAVVLLGTTLIRELVDCEKYYDSSVRAMHQQLSPAQLQVVDELSHWCWNVRFFQHSWIKELSSRLWEELTEEIHSAGAKGSSVFSLYSGHDYTLLVLLAGMGITAYPELLSFCSFLLFEVYDRINEDGSTSRVFTVEFNPAPFEEDQKFLNRINPQATYQLKSSATQSPYWTI